MKKLIIVPGHGVCVHPERSWEHAAWVGLYDYEEEGTLLAQHCLAALALAAADEEAVLCFSGGMTREAAGRLSEAESYYEIVRAAHWWGVAPFPQRVLLEPFARDSFENILFSIGAFRSRYGHYPEELFCVGFRFKSRRFGWHVRSIGWKGNFRYLPVNDPPQRDGILNLALEGEALKFSEVQEDPWLQGPQWAAVRLARNPFGQPLPQFPEPHGFKRFLDFLYHGGTPAKLDFSD